MSETDAVVFKKRKTAGRARVVQQDDVDDVADDVPSGASSSSVQDLVTLRNLTRKPTGIPLDRLNQGDPRKKKRTHDDTTTPNAAVAGGGGGAVPTRLTHAQSHFQGETGTVDVDKHMMAYIEQQMRTQSGASDNNDEDSRDSSVTHKTAKTAEDELYAVAEKYKALSKASATSEEEREGDVTLSAAMLTSIPEVDLGIDSRLRNIQQTEHAKRLHDAQQQERRNTIAPHHDPAFAQQRFQQQPQRRQTTATDQITLDRFRQRQQNK